MALPLLYLVHQLLEIDRHILTIIVDGLHALKVDWLASDLFDSSDPIVCLLQSLVKQNHLLSDKRELILLI